MIDRLQNPHDLVICLKMLNVVSLSDHESEKRIEKIVSKHLGKKYLDYEQSADQQLASLNDDEKVELTRQSLNRLQEEDDAAKKEILLMFEEIIFADEEVLSSERKFYDMAKRLLQVNTYEIEPSVELFEYLNVLNYVSSSDFASIDEFAEIWVKYMGPDIRVYYNEAYQNLKDLDLESQIQKVGGDLRKLNQIDDEQKISIRTMVEEIIFSDDEFKVYSLFILGFTFSVALILFFNTDFLMSYENQFERIEAVFRHSLFQVVSIITTTGFVTADYTTWSPLLLLLFFGMMFLGGSAGSTSGGFKIMRHLLIIKNGVLQFKKILHPHAIIPLRYNKSSVSTEITHNILGFFIVYMLSFMIGTVVFALLGLDFESALGVSASSLGNVGPSIGSFGPMNTFFELPILAKWWSSFLMLLGRLELFTVLIVFTPYFWSNR